MNCRIHILLDVGYVGMLNRHELARTPFNEAPFGSAWLPQNQDPTKCPTLSTCKLNGDNALPVDFLRPYTGYTGGGAAVAQSGLGGGGFIADLRFQRQLQCPAGFRQPPRVRT